MPWLPDLAPPPALPMDLATARAVVDDALDRWVAGRRERMGGFIARHFGFRGAARLHRRALGWDVLRAPANIALVPPQLGLHLGGVLARRLGAPRAGHWMASRKVLMRTDADRELEWMLCTEFLDMPHPAKPEQQR